MLSCMGMYRKYYSDDKYSLRVPDEHDLETLANHRNVHPTWQNLTNPLPIYLHNQSSWLKSLNDHNIYFIAVNHYTSYTSGGDIGLCRITDIDYINSNACVGLDIFEHARRKGHGQQVFNLLVKYCFEILNLHRLWLLVREDNEAAIKIYTRAGFSEEGVMRKHLFRDGEWHNYIMMGVLRDEHHTSV